MYYAEVSTKFQETYQLEGVVPRPTLPGLGCAASGRGKTRPGTHTQYQPSSQAVS